MSQGKECPKEGSSHLTISDGDGGSWTKAPANLDNGHPYISSSHPEGEAKPPPTTEGHLDGPQFQQWRDPQLHNKGDSAWDLVVKHGIRLL